jgi:hypothetical protein
VIARSLYRCDDRCIAAEPDIAVIIDITDSQIAASLHQLHRCIGRCDAASLHQTLHTASLDQGIAASLHRRQAASQHHRSLASAIAVLHPHRCIAASLCIATLHRCTQRRIASL